MRMASQHMRRTKRVPCLCLLGPGRAATLVSSALFLIRINLSADPAKLSSAHSDGPSHAGQLSSSASAA